MKISLVDVNNIQDKGFKIHRENGTSDYLFVLFKSPAKILPGPHPTGTKAPPNEDYIPTEYGSFIIFEKGSLQSYFGTGDTQFLHDFLHFDTESPEEEALLRRIPLHTLHRLSVPDSVSRILLEMKSEKNGAFPKYKEQVLSHLGTAFVYRLISEIEGRSSIEKNRGYFPELYALRLKIYESPEKNWTVDKMCHEVNLSRSYFQALYKSFFSVYAGEDLIGARIAKAKILLSGSNLKVSEVAARCGYSNVEHFTRQFKKETGISPLKFRDGICG